jgi:signal transduction histidine kinase
VIQETRVSPRTERPLQQHVWRAFLRIALLPLLLVEVALIAVYLLANSAATGENLAAVRSLADDELARLAALEAEAIDAELEGVARTTMMYALQSAEALDRPYTLPEAQRSAYAMSPEGVFHTTRDPGGSALFYSNVTKIGAAEREKAFRTAQLDPLMRDILATQPLAVQVYFNTHDSMNRILPYFDVLSQYAPDMVIPSYNFYYEADAAHNPRREAVWTDAYVDPAGKGWMVSCIAPVYRGDFLEGVVGLDVTTTTVVGEVLDLRLPWGGYGVLLGKDGTVLALPPAGEADWGLRELTAHSYTAAIMQDTFKPDAFNVFKRPEFAELAAALTSAPRGVAAVSLGGPKVAAWATVAQTGWTLVLLAPESGIYQQASDLGARLFQIGALMVLGLVLFYAIFLGLVARRARRVSAEITTPLLEIDRLVQRVGAGEYNVEPPRLAIAELAESAAGVAAMGRQLAATNETLVAAQREAVAARDAALRASQLKSEFLATMSHELRTPLNIILGMNELLCEDLEDETLRGQAEAVGTAARDLLRIVEDVLDLSRIEAGRVSLACEPFALADTVESVASLMTMQARARGLHLAVMIDPSLPATITGDEGRVRQILFNLLGNAVKFTPAGEVVVRARAVAGAGEPRLRVEVEDTGIGIPEQARDRMFQLFTQVDGSYARRHGGTGLGLSVCRRLVELMGGAINYESTEGVGSLFWFELPIVGGRPVEEAPPFVGRRAHVAWSQPRCRAALVETLRGLGMQVTTGEAAEAAAAEVWLVGEGTPPAGVPAIALGDGSKPPGFAEGLAEPFVRAAVRAAIAAALRTG